MGTRQKIINVLIICILLTIVVGALIHVLNKNQKKLLTDYNSTQLEQTANAAVEIQESILYRIVYDYTYWNDFVDFVKQPEPEWADENIASLLTSFDIDGVWVYGLDEHLIYDSLLNNSAPLKEFPFGTKLMAKLKKDRFIRFSVYTPNELIIIQGGTIHPTGDPDRLSEPNGYFFIGKIWDAETNEEVMTLSGCNVFISPEYQDSIEQTRSNHIAISIPMPDSSNAIAGYVTFEKELEFMKLFRVNAQRMQALYLIALLIILLTISILISRWVSRPLRLIGDIIESPDNKKIASLKRSSRDFERIGVLIEQFIQQKQELLKEKDRALESDRLKSAFLANMSHEIRTPLNGVLGFAELLMDDDIDNLTRKKYLGIILSSGELLLNLINDIVDLSKIESGQLGLSAVTFNIRDTFNDLSLFFKQNRIIRERKIKLELNYSLNENLSHIQADEHRLKQILTNLVNNAAKFTIEGSIELGCRLYDENTLLFFVKDTGIGIPPESLNKIFDRFIQIDNKIVRNVEGTGLGLTITKGLVELMGGDIWLESEVNVGTVFYFTLPIMINGKAEPRTSGTITQIDANYQGKKILVVDDIAHNLLLFKSILEKTGAIVLHAETAEDGIDLLKKTPDIDLVLMDLRLPGMNGYEATQAIRKMGFNTPVVAQTAYSLEGDRNKAIASGCDDYIAKPIDRKELFEILNRFLMK